ncbi:hypothetical protein BCR34DRAFT_151485 [Clohesyomyces aquaticus]|uniref:Uncharacterized protein n=1 Tax=Clohesyomyces aquaticus TaxID=1231657 RepID=A0A1Y1YJV2_9PLEO|nr:hypothetical protein BCR34DRAFT_151485 [Clohesyomyces aquaticus]
MYPINYPCAIHGRCTIQPVLVVCARVDRQQRQCSERRSTYHPPLQVIKQMP